MTKADSLVKFDPQFRPSSLVSDNIFWLVYIQKSEMVTVLFNYEFKIIEKSNIRVAQLLKVIFG